MNDVPCPKGSEFYILRRTPACAYTSTNLPGLKMIVNYMDEILSTIGICGIGHHALTVRYLETNTIPDSMDQSSLMYYSYYMVDDNGMPTNIPIPNIKEFMQSRYKYENVIRNEALS
jgi:hypothetical protein